MTRKQGITGLFFFELWAVRQCMCIFLGKGKRQQKTARKRQVAGARIADFGLKALQTSGRVSR
jgi:hypothetical protein